MKHLFLIFLPAVLSAFFKPAFAQEIDSLIYLATDTIAYNKQCNGFTIEELSGIEYSGVGNKFLLVPQSKEKAHLFICSIDITPMGLKVSFDSTINLQANTLEGESIRINPANKKLYIAEEETEASYVHVVGEHNELITIYTSKVALRHNRGYEGLSFNSDGTVMFIGLERPLNGNITNIIAYNLQTAQQKIYTYNLDVLSNDKKQDNGITELLTLNDSTLLIVERAFLGPKNGDSVRVYKVDIPKAGTQAIKTKLLTDFSSVPRLDNVEGVTFSASRKELIFITDNNGNARQQTQFICMKIE